METIKNLIKELRSFNWGSIIGWILAIYLVIVLFGLGSNREASFWTVATILFLLFLIYAFSSQINGLKEELKKRDEIITSLWGEINKSTEKPRKTKGEIINT